MNNLCRSRVRIHPCSASCCRSCSSFISSVLLDTRCGSNLEINKGPQLPRALDSPSAYCIYICDTNSTLGTRPVLNRSRNTVAGCTGAQSSAGFLSREKRRGVFKVPVGSMSACFNEFPRPPRAFERLKNEWIMNLTSLE